MERARGRNCFGRWRGRGEGEIVAGNAESETKGGGKSEKLERRQEEGEIVVRNGESETEEVFPRNYSYTHNGEGIVPPTEITYATVDVGGEAMMLVERDGNNGGAERSGKGRVLFLVICNNDEVITAMDVDTCCNNCVLFLVFCNNQLGVSCVLFLPTCCRGSDDIAQPNPSQSVRLWADWKIRRGGGELPSTFPLQPNTK